MNHMITRLMDNEPHIDQIILMDPKPKMQDSQDPQCKKHRGLGFYAWLSRLENNVKKP